MTFLRKVHDLSRRTKIILSCIIGTVLTLVSYYLTLPALNPCSKGFWIYLIFVAFFYGVPLGLARLEISHSFGKFNTKPKINKIFLIIIAIPLVALLLGNIISSAFFSAHRYANVIEVTEADFATDMPEADTVTNISLMDTASARVIGNRALGSLSDVVSQYELRSTYNQINYKGAPQKVSNLEYVDFFRWLNNRSVGIPGYVMVDPVNSKAEYVKLAKSMKYVESGRFGDDLERKLRFSYPTKIFDSINFELDDEGNPWFVVSCVSPRVGMFGAMDVKSVILFNPCDGSSTLYKVEDVPAWVDNVFDGQLACRKYDWYGTLSGGFWNSMVGNKNCKRTTDDFGYIVRGDDVWYYTGVTSLVSDESNIGFIISNARTGEYKYYPVVGAEEYSAMSAAAGEVQEKGYVASFPALINVSGQATYIMVLKDEGGLVKLYALVNVENYSIVATGQTQNEAKVAYYQLLVNRGIIADSDIPKDDLKDVTIEVADIKMASFNNTTYVYVVGKDGFFYRGDLAKNEELILVKVGETYDISYRDGDSESIRLIEKIAKK